MDKLQKEFGDKIQILPYAPEKTDVVEHIFARIKKQMDLSIPSASDSPYQEMYKIFGSLDKVWIYKGKFIAVTGKNEVNSANIEAVLNGRPIIYNKHFKNLNDFSKLQFNDSVILRKEGGKFQSSLSGSMKGFVRDQAYVMPSKEGKKYGKRFVNYSIKNLYAFANEYCRIYAIEDIHGNHIPDTKTYCYEFLYEPTDDSLDYKRINKEACQLMYKDLKEAFGYSLIKTKRKAKTYVLKELEGIDEKLSSKGGPKVYDVTAFYFTYKNVPMSRLIDKLKYCMTTNEIQFINDETSFEGNVDIDINVPTYDFKAMRKALRDYGLDLTIEEREQDVYILASSK